MLLLLASPAAMLRQRSVALPSRRYQEIEATHNARRDEGTWNNREARASADSRTKCMGRKGQGGWVSPCIAAFSKGTGEGGG